MCKCWSEKFEKRPTFSLLGHSLGNMLADSYKKVQCSVFTISFDLRLQGSLYIVNLRSLMVIFVIHLILDRTVSSSK